MSNTELQVAKGGQPLVTTEDHAVTVFNPEVFESLHKVATLMADSSLVPETLVKEKVNGNLELLPLEKRVSNCFLVVEQAHRWAMSPFAAVACASVVHGRLMWEGKLIAAVVEAKLGVRLNYTFNGKTGDNLGVVVSGTRQGETEPCTVSGTVGDWKTTGNNSPWSKESGRERQLRYRGAREWARAFAPSAILGIIAEDEAQDYQREAKDVTNSYVRKEAIDPCKQIEEKKPEPEVGENSENLVRVFVMDVEIKESAPGAKKAWTAYIVNLAVDGNQFTAGTYDEDMGKLAQSLTGQEALEDNETTYKRTQLTQLKALDDEGIC